LPNRFDRLAQDIATGGTLRFRQTLVNEPIMFNSFEEGKDEARAEGRIETRTKDVIAVLQARGIAVPDTARERVLAQTDLDLLERWLVKASVASSIDEVIAPS
jgi:hypothetical protein